VIFLRPLGAAGLRRYDFPGNPAALAVGDRRANSRPAELAFDLADLVPGDVDLEQAALPDAERRPDRAARRADERIRVGGDLGGCQRQRFAADVGQDDVEVCRLGEMNLAGVHHVPRELQRRRARRRRPAGYNEPCG